jgi:hypothetical protein
LTPEEYGRKCVAEEGGVFTQWGYVYEREKVSVTEHEQPAPATADITPALSESALTTVPNTDSAVFAVWQVKVDNNHALWREDARYRHHNDGALYYLGGESGQYMRLANDGKLTVGRYNFAAPGIKDATLIAEATRDMGGYDMAVLLAAQLGGARFLSDMDGMAHGVESDAPQAKPEAKHIDGYTSVLDAIEKAKSEPKPPHKAKARIKSKSKNDDEL